MKSFAKSFIYDHFPDFYMKLKYSSLTWMISFTGFSLSSWKSSHNFSASNPLPEYAIAKVMDLLDLWRYRKSTTCQRPQPPYSPTYIGFVQGMEQLFSLYNLKSLCRDGEKKLWSAKKLTFLAQYKSCKFDIIVNLHNLLSPVKQSSFTVLPVIRV